VPWYHDVADSAVDNFCERPPGAKLTKRSAVARNYRDTRKFLLELDRVAFAEWLGKAVTSPG
jgi:hypothetical protein